MPTYFGRARKRCWEIYGRYYQDGKYKSHDARYREAIMKYLNPDACILDAGCGSEMWFTREFCPKAHMAVGLDIEQPNIVTPGPYGLRSDLNSLPFKDRSFDIIISKSVFEHLLNPEVVFGEFARVLKPNGVVVILTPNKYHYDALIAKVTPFWFHRWILSMLLNWKEEDTFPTYYRANSKKQIIYLFNRSNLTPKLITLFNQYPAYLMFSPLLFRLGIVFERFTSRHDILANWRGWVLAVAMKEDRK